jgi:hypothetical protein
VGKWAGRVGELAIKDTTGLLQSLRGELSVSMGISLEEYDALVESYKKEVEEHKTLFLARRFCAQKLTKA